MTTRKIGLGERELQNAIIYPDRTAIWHLQERDRFLVLGGGVLRQVACPEPLDLTRRHVGVFLANDFSSSSTQRPACELHNAQSS
ncbi:MAG: hypothetical protein QNJ20_12275 [Paracoccaceae bacterium]|nr:hypothetical protein [Paracoccaceae bacterium]